MILILSIPDSTQAQVAETVHKQGWEELPHVQGKEQWLQFAEAAVKRFPTSKVRETKVRW